MASLRTLRILGVPEHFNRPFHRARANNAFEAAGIDLQWQDAPGGTGEMLRLVTENAADVAIALTEGIVAGIVKQENTCPLRYCGEYVTSPLRWMVATGATRGADSVKWPSDADPTSNRKLRVSVSRLGSGSHLMAFVLARSRGFDPERIEFVIHDTFRTMRRAVAEGAADIFLWEWYTTIPFVEAGEVTPVTYVDTPWHCFGFVSRKNWLELPGNRQLLADAAAVVAEEAASFIDPAHEESSLADICLHFRLSRSDAAAWLSRVNFLRASSSKSAGASTGAGDATGENGKNTDGGLLASKGSLSVGKGMLEGALQCLVSVGALAVDAVKEGQWTEDKFVDSVCRIVPVAPPSTPASASASALGDSKQIAAVVTPASRSAAKSAEASPPRTADVAGVTPGVGIISAGATTSGKGERAASVHERPVGAIQPAFDLPSTGAPSQPSQRESWAHTKQNARDKVLQYLAQYGGYNESLGSTSPATTTTTVAASGKGVTLTTAGSSSFSSSSTNNSNISTRVASSSADGSLASSAATPAGGPQPIGFSDARQALMNRMAASSGASPPLAIRRAATNGARPSDAGAVSASGTPSVMTPGFPTTSSSNRTSVAVAGSTGSEAATATAGLDATVSSSSVSSGVGSSSSGSAASAAPTPPHPQQQASNPVAPSPSPYAHRMTYRHAAWDGVLFDIG